jgi:hypothetical protein
VESSTRGAVADHRPARNTTIKIYGEIEVKVSKPIANPGAREGYLGHLHHPQAIA